MGLGLVWWTEAEAEAEAERLSRGFKAKPTGKWERKEKPSADWRRSITHCTLYVSNLFAKVAFFIITSRKPVLCTGTYLFVW